MDEIISRLGILLKTMSILDGQKHVRTSTEEYTKIVEALNEAKNLVKLHRNELELAKDYIEHLRNKKEHLEYLNKKSLAIKIYIREVPKPTPSPVRTPTVQSPSPLSEISRDNFGSLHGNPPANGVNQTYQPSTASTADNIRSINNNPLSSNFPTTPKPRANLVTSISYVSNSEYAEIPQYMKGRIKFEELNAFVDLFNEIISKKYSLLGKPRGQIKAQNQMDWVQKWNAQKTSVMEGLYFIGADDFTTLKNHKLSKKDYSIFVILRHLKKIKEVKHKTSKFFAIVF